MVLDEYWKGTEAECLLDRVVELYIGTFFISIIIVAIIVQKSKLIYFN